MSGGLACRDWAHMRAGKWVVSQRRCNHSAFNGSRRTLSDWSEVMCLDCRRRWRTKAAYVSGLRDATSAERIA